LDEKVELMDGHPKIPRLHLVLSDEAEGLHGLALGGPGGWGRAAAAAAHHHLSAGKGPGRNLGHALMKKIGALEG
jgi:beta-glucosidase